MRLFEIVSPPTTFAITSKFASNYARAVRKHPDVAAGMLAFCEAKLEGRKYGKRDVPFTGSPLAGFQHAHINVKDGLFVVIYSRSGETIKMYELLLHKDYEGNSVPALRKWLRSIPDSAFTVINPDQIFTVTDIGDPQETLSDEERAKVMDEIYYLITEEAFETLKAAVVDNDWGELLNWINEAVPSVSTPDLLDAFDGQDGLKNIILDGLKSYGKLDNFKEFLSTEK